MYQISITSDRIRNFHLSAPSCFVNLIPAKIFGIDEAGCADSQKLASRKAISNQFGAKVYRTLPGIRKSGNTNSTDGSKGSKQGHRYGYSTSGADANINGSVTPTDDRAYRLRVAELQEFLLKCAVGSRGGSGASAGRDLRTVARGYEMAVFLEGKMRSVIQILDIGDNVDSKYFVRKSLKLFQFL
jgi:hypothetical protein